MLGVRVADEGVKAALIADGPDAFFTTPHFDGYAAVLVEHASYGGHPSWRVRQQAFV